MNYPDLKKYTDITNDQLEVLVQPPLPYGEVIVNPHSTVTKYITTIGIYVVEKTDDNNFKIFRPVEEDDVKLSYYSVVCEEDEFPALLRKEIIQEYKRSNNVYKLMNRALTMRIHKYIEVEDLVTFYTPQNLGFHVSMKDNKFTCYIDNNFRYDRTYDEYIKDKDVLFESSCLNETLYKVFFELCKNHVYSDHTPAYDKLHYEEIDRKLVLMDKYYKHAKDVKYVFPEEWRLLRQLTTYGKEGFIDFRYFYENKNPDKDIFVGGKALINKFKNMNVNMPVLYKKITIDEDKKVSLLWYVTSIGRYIVEYTSESNIKVYKSVKDYRANVIAFESDIKPVKDKEFKIKLFEETVYIDIFFDFVCEEYTAHTSALEKRILDEEQYYDTLTGDPVFSSKVIVGNTRFISDQYLNCIQEEFFRRLLKVISLVESSEPLSKEEELAIRHLNNYFTLRKRKGFRSYLGQWREAKSKVAVQLTSKISDVNMFLRRALRAYVLQPLPYRSVSISKNKELVWYITTMGRYIVEKTYIEKGSVHYDIYKSVKDYRSGNKHLFYYFVIPNASEEDICNKFHKFFYENVHYDYTKVRTSLRDSIRYATIYTGNKDNRPVISYDSHDRSTLDMFSKFYSHLNAICPNEAAAYRQRGIYINNYFKCYGREDNNAPSSWWQKHVIEDSINVLNESSLVDTYLSITKE